MNRKDYEAAIKREVEEWEGVEVEFVEGGKHPKAKFTFNGKILSRAYSGTPSDSAFGVHSMLGDMRRAMKKLGATRSKPEPSKEEDEKPYSKPNDGKAKRPNPVATEKADPKPDVAEQLVETGLVETKTGDDEETESERIAREAAAIEDGIYFDLDERVYHAIEATGSSDLGKLLISPATYWRGSALDPDRPEHDEDSTNAQIIGKAYHVARLEPHRFMELYARKPAESDFPKEGLLSNTTQIGDALAELGEPKKKAGEKVAEQAQRLEDNGYEGPIFPLIKARFEQSLNGRIPLDGKVYDEIEVDMERIEKVPAVVQHLRGGYSEVSVIWTDENGTRCKSRFDRLKVGEWTDLKTFVNSNGKPVDQAITDAFRYNRYYVQATHYRDGYEAIQAGLVDVVKGDEAQRAMIEEIKALAAPPRCYYVFQEKGGVPNLFVRQFMFTAIDAYRAAEVSEMLDDPDKRAVVLDAMSSRSRIWQRGKIEIARAKELHRTYSQVYERGEPWAPIDPEGRIGDDDFNPYWLEEGR